MTHGFEGVIRTSTGSYIWTNVPPLEPPDPYEGQPYLKWGKPSNFSAGNLPVDPGLGAIDDFIPPDFPPIDINFDGPAITDPGADQTYYVSMLERSNQVQIYEDLNIKQNETVTFKSTTGPSGVNPDTTYYVKNPYGSLFQLGFSFGSSETIDFINDGTGQMRYIATGSGNSTISANINGDTDTITTSINTGLKELDKISFVSVDQQTGLLPNTSYFVKNPSGNSFQISDNPGGSIKDITASGTGSLNYQDPLASNNLTTGATVDGNSNTICTSASTGLKDGDQVLFNNVDQSTGLSPYTSYFVKNTSGNCFQISDTLGGPTKDITGSGTGSLNYQDPLSKELLPPDLPIPKLPKMDKIKVPKPNLPKQDCFNGLGGDGGFGDPDSPNNFPKNRKDPKAPKQDEKKPEENNSYVTLTQCGGETEKKKVKCAGEGVDGCEFEVETYKTMVFRGSDGKYYIFEFNDTTGSGDMSFPGNTGIGNNMGDELGIGDPLNNYEPQLPNMQMPDILPKDLSQGTKGTSC